MITPKATLFFCAALLGLSAAGSSAAPMLSQDLEYQRAPKVLGNDAPRVGEWILNLEFAVLGGGRSSFEEVAGERGLVVVMRDPECPLSKKYSPRLRELESEAQKMGLPFLYVGMESEEAAQGDVKLYGLSSTYAVDPDGHIARELDARTSTEVFVIDSANTMAYRGMIDDQYGLGFSKAMAEHYYLVDAMENVRDGQHVAIPATTAQGCKLQIEAGERGERELTYHNRISRIVQDSCTTCHRAGEAGPFELTNYKQVNKRRSMIAWALEDHVMPPWFASEGTGPWSNDTSLTEAELADFLAWIDNEGPEGDPAHAPLEREWASGWSIGEPDLVVSFPKPFEVPAEGVVDYQYFYAETNLTEDKWVQAIEIRSSAPQVTHHALLFLESRESGRGQNGNFQTGGETYFASSVPGQHGLQFPAGSGKLLPAGSWLKFQMHYTPNGTADFDQTSVAFIFSDEPLVEVHTDSAYNDGFTIPANSFDVDVTAEFRFPEAGTLLSLFPHTHVRGISFLCELIYPDGEEEMILELPFYDFNWQMNYQLLTPRRVPAGTRLRATAWYDNTSDNPANPDPNANVHFGEQTFEEMMISYVNWIPVSSRAIEAAAKK